jgi:hypothetical protein
MVGMADTPGSLPSLPDNVTPGVPGPNAPASIREDNWVVGNSNPMPNDISEHGNPLMDAGFQWIAPAESIGQAAATPPIDSFTGPTPRKAIPCPSAGNVCDANATTRIATPPKDRLRPATSRLIAATPEIEAIFSMGMRSVTEKMIFGYLLDISGVWPRWHTRCVNFSRQFARPVSAGLEYGG